ncbi:MAG: DUF1778 domain-containing protein [Gammaproteobacteria bacterium]|nr:DUF1778 domain-containing protein [Gammaproteobacteria bacterium]
MPLPATHVRARPVATIHLLGIACRLPVATRFGRRLQPIDHVRHRRWRRIATLIRIRQNAVLINEDKVMSTARFDLKLDPDDKETVAKAAALMGTTMAGFVRSAAKEKAQALLDREARITLTRGDAEAFIAALDAAFRPNAALEQALSQARRQVRRA